MFHYILFICFPNKQFPHRRLRHTQSIILKQIINMSIKSILVLYFHKKQRQVQNQYHSQEAKTKKFRFKGNKQSIPSIECICHHIYLPLLIFYDIRKLINKFYPLSMPFIKSRTHGYYEPQIPQVCPIQSHSCQCISHTKSHY